MQDGARPMPPGLGVTVPSVEVTAFNQWVTQGMPAGSCVPDAGATPDGGLPDGGSSDGGSTDAGNPWTVPAQCSTNRTYFTGKSSSMAPGRACIACHQNDDEAPQLQIGGTVYATAHEPNDCYGADGSKLNGAVVVITDANGKTYALKVNSGGNFRMDSSSTFATPYRAKLVVGGMERHMATPQTNGDCNACHTQYGANGAPGRIILP
jgi:hypothetical protein